MAVLTVAGVSVEIPDEAVERTCETIRKAANSGEFGWITVADTYAPVGSTDDPDLLWMRLLVGPGIPASVASPREDRVAAVDAVQFPDA